MVELDFIYVTGLYLSGFYRCVNAGESVTNLIKGSIHMHHTHGLNPQKLNVFIY